MWNNKFKFAVSLQIKQLQFRLKTWRQGREIARAYGKKKFLNIRALIVCAMCLIIIAIGTPGIIQLSVHHRAAVKKFSEPKSKVLVSDTGKKIGPAATAPETIPTAGAAPQTASPGMAQPATRDTTDEGKQPPGKLGEAALTMNYCILANKADRTLYLLSKEGSGDTWKNAEKFPILVGKNDGQKISAGDQRTPEGIYFIVGRKESEELDPIYGPLAYMLNYPNEDDRKAGRTGQGIWIHGTREDTTREATRGCIVLDNDNIMTLSRYLQLGIGTPVAIINSNGLTAPEQAMNFRLLRALRERILFEYNTRRAEFTGVLSQWKLAWESRNIENYSRFYDPDRFFGEGMHWDAWREKKQRTFQNYTSINIGLDKICVSEFSDSTAVILFMQRYESNVYRVQRPKKLSFFKTDGRWRIFKEETYTRQELVL